MQDNSTSTAHPPQIDSGLACLVMLARFHNVAASPEQLTHEYAEDGRLFGRAEMLLAAKKLGLKAKSARSSGVLPAMVGRCPAKLRRRSVGAARQVDGIGRQIVLDLLRGCCASAKRR